MDIFVKIRLIANLELKKNISILFSTFSLYTSCNSKAVEILILNNLLNSFESSKFKIKINKFIYNFLLKPQHSLKASTVSSLSQEKKKFTQLLHAFLFLVLCMFYIYIYTHDINFIKLQRLFHKKINQIFHKKF